MGKGCQSTFSVSTKNKCALTPFPGKGNGLMESVTNENGCVLSPTPLLVNSSQLTCAKLWMSHIFLALGGFPTFVFTPGDIKLMSTINDSQALWLRLFVNYLG